MNSLIKTHNSIDENSIIDDVKIERVHVNNDELTKSLQEYKKEKEKQFQLHNRSELKAKKNKPVSSFTFNHFNSMEDIELSLASFSDTSYSLINSDKYNESICRLEKICFENKCNYAANFERKISRFENLVKAKLNKEEIEIETIIETEYENQLKDNTSEENYLSDDNEDFDSTENESDVDEPNQSFNNKLFNYYYYYNYYYKHYYEYFFNSNE